MSSTGQTRLTPRATSTYRGKTRCPNEASQTHQYLTDESVFPILWSNEAWQLEALLGRN